jgi:hypothetical protein
MKIAIISGGELADRLAELLQEDTVAVIGVRLRRQGFVLANSDRAAKQLQYADITVNLLPTGFDFSNCGIIDFVPLNCIIIDFSRPPIPSNCGRKIIMGNRLRHRGIRFYPPLPGWLADEIPACSLPCLLASQGDLSVCKNQHDFNLVARYMRFNKGGNHA